MISRHGFPRAGPAYTSVCWQTVFHPPRHLLPPVRRGCRKFSPSPTSGTVVVHGSLGEFFVVPIASSSFFARLSKSPISYLNGLGVAADGAVGWCKMENRFSSFLAHRDQAAIMLQGGEASGVLRWCGGSRRIFKHGLMVNRWHAVDPFIIGFDGAAEPDAMLLNDVPKREHLAPGKFKIWIAPVSQPFLPDPCASPEGWAPDFSNPEGKKGRHRAG